MTANISHWKFIALFRFQTEFLNNLVGTKHLSWFTKFVLLEKNSYLVIDFFGCLIPLDELDILSFILKI